MNQKLIQDLGPNSGSIVGTNTPWGRLWPRHQKTQEPYGIDLLDISRPAPHGLVHIANIRVTAAV